MSFFFVFVILVIGGDNKQAVLAQKYLWEESGDIKLSHLPHILYHQYEFHKEIFFTFYTN